MKKILETVEVNNAALDRKGIKMETNNLQGKSAYSKLSAVIYLAALLFIFAIPSCSEDNPADPSGTPIAGMVFIQGGTFQMGSDDTNFHNEQPIHSITLSSYYIAEIEVTQAEWIEVMGSNPSNFQSTLFPVESVSWNEVINFCNQKSTRDGLTPVYTINGADVTANWSANGYRLPTEAEWEYAARGGNKSGGYTYSGSNTIGDVAWYTANSGGTTHQTDTKLPNELGIYDMSGNVWEWCWDWYNEDYYDSSPSTNPKGPTTGTKRVFRGGGWYDIADFNRVAFRVARLADGSHDDLGFRLVRTK